MKRKVVIYSLILLTIIAGIFFIRSRRSERTLTVRTAEAIQGELQSFLSTTGIIQSRYSKEYYGVQGKVLEIKVRIGDAVKTGDVLVTYETQDLDTAVRQAEIQYENAVLQRDDLYSQKEDMDEKIAELDEQIEALEAENIDKSVIDPLEKQRDALMPISEERIRQAENAVVSAKLSVDTARENLRKNESSIVAEGDGVVTAVNVVEGAMDAGAQPALVVQDIEKLKAVVSLGKYDAEKVQLGQEVVIKGGGQTYEGKVSFIDPVAKKSMGANGGETSLEVQIDILEEAPELKIEFEADVDILVGEIDNGVIIPLESIKVEKGNKNLVYVLEGNVVRERSVETGLQSAVAVEIITGVKSGERVILNPSTQIVEGIRAADATEGEKHVKGQ